MPVAPDAQSLTTAAEQAASNGDFSTAAHYLKLAADLQEAGAGSMPVELASTLNNLGVVYERLDRAADAERCYRRAHAVARAVLPADHPSVVLSEKNLREFCEGRGIPLDEVPPRVEDSPAESDRPPRRALVVGGIGVVVFGALVLFGIRALGTRDVPSTPAPESTPAATVEPTAPPATSRPEPAPAPAPPAPVLPEPEQAVTAAVAPSVVTAALCGALETRGAEWQCAPPSGAPGALFFYTRLAAPVATTVEHRWYRDNRLHRAITLRVPPNPQHGYRTYSRITLGDARAGSWRAELRSPGGAVLHEEQFSVVP